MGQRWQRIQLAMLGRLAVVRQLQLAAAIDAKTGLLNCDRWRADAAAALAAAARVADPVGLVMVDLDRFKAVNDRLGHLGGDRTLSAVGEAIRGSLAGAPGISAVLGRLGGDEFAVLLTGGRPDRHVWFAWRLCRSVRVAGQVGSPLTASAGVATCVPATGSLDDLLAAADRALYRAKRAGGDQVMVDAEQPAEDAVRTILSS